MHIGLQLEVMKMDANKFGCFVAERRKELKMTQKDLAAKIQIFLIPVIQTYLHVAFL